MTAKPPASSTDHQSDLQSDLRRELVADLPSPAEPPVTPPVLPPGLTASTPAVSVQWTPLRWSRPRVVRAEKGAGKALKLGPLKVELSVKE